MNNTETTVCFFRDLYRTLEKMEDKDAGVLMKALFAHANEIEPDLERSPAAGLLYDVVADQMDRLDAFRKKKAKAARSKTEQNGADGSKTEQNGGPYPYPYPYHSIERSAKIQKAYGFSTERDVDYNELARQKREAEGY